MEIWSEMKGQSEVGMDGKVGEGTQREGATTVAWSPSAPPHCVDVVFLADLPHHQPIQKAPPVCSVRI